MLKSNCTLIKAAAIVCFAGGALLTFPAAGQPAAKAGASGDVQVLSGGVGEGAREELAQKAKGYNLKLVFTLSTGNYLAGVPFEVSRGNKVLVDHTSDGPWAFVKLPPGDYTVKATHEGSAQTKKVSVPKTGQRTVSFVYKAPERVVEQPHGK